MFEISYDFTLSFIARGASAKSYRQSRDNWVGRYQGQPIGYGYNGPRAQFTPEEIPLVMETLKKQLHTTPTLHIHPVPDQ